MDWIEVKDSKDIEKLLDKFSRFHDSCLKELYMWTESYVDENLSMGMSPNSILMYEYISKGSFVTILQLSYYLKV
jgi:hypothetical protein